MNKQTIEKDFISIMNVLKVSRSKLVSDFLNREPSIFLPMFKYENNPTLMNIAIESYFISWINFHFYIWRKNISAQVSDKIFMQTMNRFLRKYLSDIKKRDSIELKFFNDLIEKKIGLLNRLMYIDEQSDNNFNLLIMEYEKDKALYKRKITDLQEKK